MPMTPQSSTGSVPSRPSSTASSAPSAVASTRKRKASKARSSASVPPPLPITFPGPHEPTPPNFLRSQSALLGRAGLIGSITPAKLHTHERPSTQASRSQTSLRGSTSTHPIILDDEQDNPQARKRQSGQIQLPKRFDQLDVDVLRANILNSLAKEKNTLPVLESLIKLLGGEPQQSPSSHPPPQTFARPYNHGVIDTQSTLPESSPTLMPPPLKRRKLKHVPAGAADWDVPFPFAPGEGPEAYRDTWAQDRAKQLVTQLLELVQSATKRAAIKTAKSNTQKSRGKIPQARNSAFKHWSSREMSIETQREQSVQVATPVESVKSTCSESESIAPAGTTVVDSLDDILRSLQIPDPRGSTSTPGLSDGISVSSSSTTEVVTPGPEPFDYSAFEDWLSQLQRYIPDASPTPDSEWSTSHSLEPDSSTSSRSSSIPASIRDAPQNKIQDEAIDPTLLAISYASTSTSHTTDPPASIDTQVSADMASPSPALSHSPRTSLSSFTEPLTPLSDAFTEVPTGASTMAANQTDVHDLPLVVPKTHHPVEKDNQVVSVSPSSLTEACQVEPHRPTAEQKRKGRAEPEGLSVTSIASVSSRSTPGTVSTKGKLDKQAIIARAKERRDQLVAEIEKLKIELWETSIEAGVLVHFMRDEALAGDIDTSTVKYSQTAE